jgi:CRISPR system Cascade subunit CasA
MSAEDPASVSFDLLSQPWIPVVKDGRQVDVSLRTAVVDAHVIDALAMTDGPQFAGLLRMLTALVMDVYGRTTDNQQWDARRLEGSFNPADFDRYSDQIVGRNRFDLFDAERPFLQSALVPDEGKTVASMIPHVATGNTPPLFSPDTDKTPRTLTAAEAARALVAQMTIAVPNPGRAGGTDQDRSWKGFSFAGRAGIVGFVAPLGTTLFETLMLNIHNGKTEKGDAPAWRRQQSPPASRDARRATGMLDLLTWTPRRVRLIPDTDGTVTRIGFRGGDALTVLENAHEPHTAFRISDGKGEGSPTAGTQYPRKHLAHTVGWRGLPTLLAMKRVGDSDVTSHLFRDLGARVATVLPSDYRVTVASLAIAFGQMSALYTDIAFDAYPLPARVFGEDERDMRDVLIHLVGKADKVRQIVRSLALSAAQVSMNNVDKDAKASGAYANDMAARFTTDIDAITRRFLAGLAGSPDRYAEGMQAWEQAVHQLALRYRDEIATIVGGRAFSMLSASDPRTGVMKPVALPYPVASQDFYKSLGEQIAHPLRTSTLPAAQSEAAQ